MSNPDVVVIGAGAAGIGAGLALRRHNVPFVILEAKDRVGGRAYSESHSLGHLWDHGCHWFHSASKNPLRRIALALGHDFIDAPQPYGTEVWHNGAWSDGADIDASILKAIEEVIAAGRAGRDVAASDFADKAHPHFAFVRQILTLSYSQEAENISTVDAFMFDDTHENIPVRGGYGALVARLAALLPVRLNTAVTSIEAVGDGVRVVTQAGMIAAKSVVLAVPQRVIERGGITFKPGLPGHISEAFANVPMGWFEKVGIAFDSDVFGGRGGNGIDIFDESLPIRYATAVNVQPFGRPIAVVHIGGDTARDLQSKDLAAFAEDALASAFGAGIRARITRRAVTGWKSDPFIGGAYSCARPGHGAVRARFAEPVHDRIFICGEHTSLENMATAHGAFVSGHHAAQRALGLPASGADPLWLPA